MPYCKECGKEIERGTRFCPHCGGEVAVRRSRFSGEVKPRPTRLWYLVPLVFGIIGGIVGYVGVRNEDKKMAKHLLIFGIAWTFILYIGLSAIVATLVGGLGSRGAPPSVMLTVTAQAQGSNVVLTIMHYGGDDLNISDLKVEGSDTSGVMQTATLNPSSGTISVGETITAIYNYGNSPTGTVITVYVIHNPSKQRLFSSSAIAVQG